MAVTSWPSYCGIEDLGVPLRYCYASSFPGSNEHISNSNVFSSEVLLSNALLRGRGEKEIKDMVPKTRVAFHVVEVQNLNWSESVISNAVCRHGCRSILPILKLDLLE